MGSIRVIVSEMVILEALRRQNSQYGFKLKGAIESMLGRKQSFGGMYTTLHRVEEKGLVIAEWEDERNPGGPRRKFYKLTPKGKEVCDEMRGVLARILAG